MTPIAMLSMRALAGGHLDERLSGVARLHIPLSTPLDRLPNYHGPTWLDETIVSKWRPVTGMLGFSTEVGTVLVARGRWLADKVLSY